MKRQLTDQITKLLRRCEDLELLELIHQLLLKSI